MIVKTLIPIIMFYILATVLVYLISDRSIFVPRPSSYTDSAPFFKLETAGSKKISTVYLPNPKAKYTILYSHGNADDLGKTLPLLQEMHAWGFAVASYDYEGYGTSNGKPNEQACYDDINTVYAYLTKEQKIAPQHIIAFGRSLGSGPTIELATHKPIAGVILEGGFMSAYRVVTYIPIFLFDKFNNIAKIKKIKAPILFIHGTRDKVVPFWHAKQLYASFSGRKQNYWLENTGHNDIDYTSNEYKDMIMKFAHSLMEHEANA